MTPFTYYSCRIEQDVRLYLQLRKEHETNCVKLMGYLGETAKAVVLGWREASKYKVSVAKRCVLKAVCLLKGFDALVME